MKRALLISVMIMLVVGLIVGGCTPPTTPPPPTPPPPTPEPTPEPTPPLMEPMTVTFNNAQWSPTSPPGMVFQWFTDTVTDRTDGLLKFNHVGSFSLTKPGEEIAALQSGLCDVGNTCVVYHPGPLGLNVGFMRCVPFGISDLSTGMDLAYQMYYEEPTALVDEYTDLGLQFLFITIDTPYVFETKEPVNTLDEFDGMKIACAGKYGPMWLQVLGATTTPTPVGDRPTSLQTGVIDASAVPLEVGFPFKLYEFAPNLRPSEWGIVTGNPISWEMEKFNELPPEVQKIVIDTGKEAFLQNLEIVEGWEADALATMEAAGVTIYPAFSDEVNAEWAALILAEYGDPVAGWVADMEGKGKMGAAEIAEKWLRLQREAGYEFPIEWQAK